MSALLLFCSGLSAQLLVEEDGSVGVGVDTVREIRLAVSNPNSAHGIHLWNGRDGVDRDMVGLYNYMRRGGGKRTGVLNYLRPSGGTGVGSYNDVGNWGTETMYGVVNRLKEPGTGTKVGVYNSMSDQNDSQSGAATPMIGNLTKIRHHNRQSVYGNKVEIRSRNYDSSHNQYGYHVSFSRIRQQGATSYGVYSFVPGEQHYAGYFVGNVTVTGNLIEASDARLKQNEAKIQRPLSIIKKLKPKKYKFKSNNRFSYATDRDHYGFMAQEVEQVMPALVHDIQHPPVLEPVEEERGRLSKPNNKQLQLELREGIADTADIVDIEGQTYRVVHPAETLKGVRYSDLIAVLTGAVQEQQTMIEEMRDELDELRAEIKALKECTKCGGAKRIKGVSMPGVGQGASTLAPPAGEGADGSGVSVYPNPASGRVTIEHSVSEVFTVRVLAGDGREVLRAQAQDGIIVLDAGGWMNGTYVVDVRTPGGDSIIRPLIINR